MKKLSLLALVLSVSGMSFAGGLGQASWNWPLVSVWQSYESGTQVPMDSTEGGLAWPSTNALDDPYLAAREGTNKTLTGTEKEQPKKASVATQDQGTKTSSGS
jgi:hypothetical protein